MYIGGGLGDNPSGIAIVVQFWAPNPAPWRQPRQEKLIIDKLSSLPQVGPPSMGHWKSDSWYLGQESGGKYLLRNWHLETFGPDRGGSLADPVGWFIDSKGWDSPFLVLSNFDKQKGLGRLWVRNLPPNLSLPVPDNYPTNVEWFKTRQ